MTARKYLLFFIAGFTAATLFVSFFNFGSALAGFFLLLVFVLVILKFLNCFEFRISVFVLLMLGASVGVARYQLASRPPTLTLGQFSGQVLVNDEPDVRETHTKLDTECLEDSNTRCRGDRVLLLVPHYPQYQYGDVLRVSGDVEPLSYLEKDNIYLQMFYPEVELLEHGRGFFLKRWLFALKNSYVESLSRVLPEPHASLAAGLTVGARQSLGAELLEKFRRVGLIHIIVLSGFNVMIIATGLMAFLRRFTSQKVSVWGGSLAIILFTIMTGAGAATVRAAIMAIVAVFARASGRVYESTVALVAAGFLMLLYNPKVLVFDTGFQLSFLATLGLIYFTDPIKHRMLRILKHPMFKHRVSNALLEIASMTIAAQIAVAPWIAYKMGTFSVVALPINLLVLPLIPFTMALVALAASIGWVSAALASPFAWLSWLPLAWTIKLTELFSALPFASFNIRLPLALTLLIYATFCWLAVKVSPKVPQTTPAST